MPLSPPPLHISETEHDQQQSPQQAIESPRRVEGLTSAASGFSIDTLGSADVLPPPPSPPPCAADSVAGEDAAALSAPEAPVLSGRDDVFAYRALGSFYVLSDRQVCLSASNSSVLTHSSCSCAPWITWNMSNGRPKRE
jgi:hypothetical protein